MYFLMLYSKESLCLGLCTQATDLATPVITNNEVEILFATIECFQHEPIEITNRLRAYAVNLNEKCGTGTCSYQKIEECISNGKMVCLPKVFYTILPSYRPQPHKGMEYGDVSGEIKAGNSAYELKGIIKKNSENRPRKVVEDGEKNTEAIIVYIYGRTGNS